jgi:GntR family transcriptional regulator
MNAAEFLDPQHWLEPSAGPRYLQLRQRLEEGIEQGVWQPQAPMPAEREIASMTRLSRVTIRKATESLVQKGLIIQRQGSGSFVSANIGRVEQSLSRLTSFSEDMRRRGLNTESRWLERGVFLPSPAETVALALSTQDMVARLGRVRLADDRPMAIERAAVPVSYLPNPDDVTTSLYEALDEIGYRPVRALQNISAVNVKPSDAEILDITPGAAGLKIERTSYLSTGIIVEFTQSLYRGDAYDFVAELNLIGG